MKIIFKIARAELRYLFFSPIAWFVIFLFYVSMAIAYTGGLGNYAMYQEVMLDMNESWPGFDKGIGNVLAAMVTGIMMKYLYLFIPLLTMGIINREISNGTIKLLYSSPVSTRHIVFGKFLGLMFFNLLLLLIFAIILTSLQLNTQHAEYAWYLSIMLGVFLLMGAYSAIGLFISCLTGYQIVAAVITFSVFFLLSVIGGLWQQYDMVRDITFFLTISGKAEKMMTGLITSRDIIYFLLVITMFIGFAMIKLKSIQHSWKWTVNASRYSLLALVIIVLGYFSSRPGYIAYLDVTKNKINTLHPEILKVLNELDGSPLTVTLYTNLLDKNAYYGLPQMRNHYVWGVWEPFIRFYPNIKFRYEYYYDVVDGDSTYYRKYPGKSLKEIMAIEAEMFDIRPSIFKAPAAIRKEIGLAPEGMHLVMQVEYKGKKEFLRTYMDPQVWPDQLHYAATLKRLTRSKDVSVHFVSGHFERNPMSYAPREFGPHTTLKGQRRTLINEGVDTDTVSLAIEEIPENTDLLVVADPKSDYSTVEKQKLISYLDKGGNALIYLEPGKQFILNSVLKTIGVYPGTGVVVSPNEHEQPHIFSSPLTPAGNFLAKEPGMEIFQQYKIRGGIVENAGTLDLSYEAIDGFTAEPVIAKAGNERTWIENGRLVVDSAAPVFNPAEGDQQKNEYIIALKLSRNKGNKEQRIIVTGDADFMTFNRMKNGSVNTAFYSWLLYNRYPVYTNYPFAPDLFLKTTTAKTKITKALFVYIGSAALLLMATILLVRRKRK